MNPSSALISEIPHTIEDIAPLRVTLKMLKFWSFLLGHTWRRYFAIGYSVLIVATESTNIYRGYRSAYRVVFGLYIIVLLLNTLLRTFSLCWNRFAYEACIEELRLIYVELVQFKETTVNAMLAETNHLIVRFSKINIVLGCFTAIGFLLNPIFTEEKILPVDVYLPGVDKYASPYYEVIYACESIFTPAGVAMYIPYTNLFVAFIFFAILMAKVLQHKLRALHQLPRHRVQSELIWCIEYQLKFINFFKFVNRLGTFLHLIEFIMFGALLCVMLFLFIITEAIGGKVIITMFTSTIVGQSVVLYYCSDLLYNESIAIAAAAYDCDWFDLSVETQKYLRLFIQRAQTPCSILIGNVYIMNLETLQALLNATYRYFTLLKRFYG